MKKGYSKTELLKLGKQRTFTGDALKMISFPLGGIGAGNVSLSGFGGLIDWEIYNRPSIGAYMPKTFPVIWAKEKGKDPVCRVLQGKPLPPFQGGGGGDPNAAGEGLPHMDSCTFRGEFPFAHIDFACKKLPVTVSLEAYNPFIPSNADDSGFPAAILKYTLTNRTKNPVDATVAWSILNTIGSIGMSEKDFTFSKTEFGYGQNVNEFVDDGGVRGLVFRSEKWAEDHPRYGSIALTTPDKSVTALKYWLRAGWFNPMHDFWDTFAAKGQFVDRDYPPSDEKNTDAGSLGIRAKLKPGESKTVTFYVTWHHPNYEMYWHNPGSCCAGSNCSDSAPKKNPVWKNYYASQFSSALDVAQKLNRREAELHKATKTFHDALFSTTAPPALLDAVSANLGIIKSATCIRLTDGTFYGWEGCAPMAGCCEGSCTHVWNYQQALAFLFPELERTMRTADYTYNLRADGGMCFRIQLPIGTPPNDFHACGDGQLGGIIKLYRDWKISGDDAWLGAIWPRAKRALEHAWVQWDPDKDGVIDGVQHNTYDIEFVGPNPMINVFYLGALLAGAEIADRFGDAASAAEYRSIYRKGAAWTDKHLFNGEYYIQKCDIKNGPQYQFGTGCLSDQILGQWVASLSGLGYLLDPKHVRATLKAIFKYNWKEDLTDHANAQRVYAINDEAGLLLCSWPRGERPAFPFVYSDEVWTGIEYQVASHLILEGLLTEGLSVVKGCRDRHDGIARNPWDEFECGHHYARALASYGLLTAWSGFTFDKGAGRIGFAPKAYTEKFSTFWAIDGAWGVYAQKGRQASLTVLHGALTLRQLDLAPFVNTGQIAVTWGRSAFVCSAVQGKISLPKALTLTAGQTLSVGPTEKRPSKR